VEIKSEAIKGRRGLVAVQEISLSKFEEFIINILQSKGIKI
jgi:hypothetical protein